MVDEYKGYQDDRIKFERIGIIEGNVFEIKELNGLYVLDLEQGCVFECNEKGKKIVKVNGLYQSLLRGAWHKKVHGTEY